MTDKLYVVMVNMDSKNQKVHILNPSAIGASHMLEAVRMDPGENFVMRTFTTLDAAKAFADSWDAQVVVIGDDDILQ